MRRSHQSIQVADHEILSCGQIVPEQFQHHIIHHTGMQNSPDDGEQQKYKGKEREQGIRRDRECKRVYLSA